MIKITMECMKDVEKENKKARRGIPGLKLLKFSHKKLS